MHVEITDRDAITKRVKAVRIESRWFADESFLTALADGLSSGDVHTIVFVKGCGRQAVYRFTEPPPEEP